VSVATIFNYFATKEDLFFDRADEVIAAPSALVWKRKRGESVTRALHRGFRTIIETAAVDFFDRNAAKFVATVDDSPALRARARLVLEQTEAKLAETLASELHARATDPTPRILAAVFVAIERTLLDLTREHLLRRAPSVKSKRELLHACDRAFELVEKGTRREGA
jgi:AcrR family transcriptional regulator